MTLTLTHFLRSPVTPTQCPVGTAGMIKNMRLFLLYVYIFGMFPVLMCFLLIFWSGHVSPDTSIYKFRVVIFLSGPNSPDVYHF